MALTFAPDRPFAALRALPVKGGSRAALALLLVLALLVGWRLVAQVEGERGIAPYANTGDFEVAGIKVNATGKDAEDARENGWKEAQKQAWKVLYERTHKGEKAPELPESQLLSMVSAVVVEREEIGPRRYVATLGVIFDRARTGEIFGATNSTTRSAPQLVIPIVYQGGVGQLYEMRTPWQRAWAEYRSSDSPMDYVRPYGGGGESLLLTAGQAGRRSRAWWRTILDEFGAANVVFPVARIERQYPGGPVRGTFTARYGADNRYLGQFTMVAPSEEKLPEMLATAVRRLDGLYAGALAQGRLNVDKSLNLEDGAVDPALLAALAAANAPAPAPAPTASTPTPGATPTAAPVVPASRVSVQVATPDPAAFDAALRALSSLPGVTGATTSSLAIGGTSVIAVGYGGDAAGLAASLRARGWQVAQSGDSLRISR